MYGVTAALRHEQCSVSVPLMALSSHESTGRTGVSPLASHLTCALIMAKLNPVSFSPVPDFCSVVLSELNMEYNPSDHPRASTIFLSKSQTDGECCGNDAEKIGGIVGMMVELCGNVGGDCVGMMVGMLGELCGNDGGIMVGMLGELYGRWWVNDGGIMWE